MIECKYCDKDENHVNSKDWWHTLEYNRTSTASLKRDKDFDGGNGQYNE